MMEKILFVSDIHYNFRIFRGNDESKARDWLIEVIEKEKPDLLLSAGDWDSGFQSYEDFLPITSRIPTFTIFGNHENMNALEKAYNPLYNNRKILIKDCELIEFDNFSVTGVNGIISKKRKKHGVPRKTLQEYIELPNKCPNATFFLTHEVPAIKVLADKIRLTPYSKYVVETFRKLNVELILGGHLHIDCFTFYKNGEFTYLRVDSSQNHKCYAIIFPRTREIVIKQDGSKIDRFIF